MAAAAPEISFSIDDLLTRTFELKASDLHLTAGSEPVVRVNGSLERLEEYGKLTPKDTLALLYRILSTEQQKLLEGARQLDLSYSVPGVARFRVNVYSQRESLAAAFRLIPTAIKTLDELGMPSSLYDLC
jgi:twitching motility protein PilT